MTHQSNFLAMTLLAFCACTGIAATSTVTRIRPQEITSIETADTVLDRGELVYCRDEANTSSAIALRIGDGTTPGGTIVSDAFALRTPFLRQLRRDEYQITTFGNVTYSNSAWEMITRRSDSSASAANTGTLVISSSYPIAEVSGTVVYDNTTWDGDDLNGRSYAVKTNYSFTVAEMSTLYMGNVNFRASISNMSVWAWVGTGLLARTNDARCSTLLVGDPATDDAAISRGWFLSSMANHRGDDWSTYAATKTVDAAWQPIRHNPYISCVSTGNAGNLVWQRRYASGTTRDLVTLSSTNRTFAMTAYMLTSSNIVVQIDASCPFASAPVIQTCTNLPGQNWTNLTTTSTWPTTTWTRATSGALLYPVFELSAAINLTNQAFYRVSATATNTDLDALTLSVPLVLLPTDATNAPSVGATVYTGPDGKLWTVNSAGSRLCLSDASSSGGSSNGVTAYIQVTNVVTLAAGLSAWASNNIIGTTNLVTLGIPQGAQGTEGGGIDAATATNIARATMARFAVTNTVSVTNYTTFSITLPAPSVCLDDVRVFATTSGSYSKRYALRFFRRPGPAFRRTDLAYVATNCLLYATTSTVAQAVGSLTNVVGDASGIVWPIDAYYQTYGPGTNDFVSYTNASATVLWQCCTNNYIQPAGSLISRVEQLGSFNYWNASGAARLEGDINPTTGHTGDVTVVIEGALK